MKPEAKMILLKRYFISSDYFDLFYSRYSAAITFQHEGLARFHQGEAGNDWQLQAANFWGTEVLPRWDVGLNELHRKRGRKKVPVL